LLDERNARVVLISLSHTQEHATAVAILESL
jgi:phosphopantetheinyl transferase (holo-ACP synthase)